MDLLAEPSTYWDYDYAIVLIGDDVLFMENLRTMEYVATSFQLP